MSIWDKLHNDELYFILERYKLKEIHYAFREKIAYEEWIEYSRQHYQPKLKSYKISQSLFASINEAPSYTAMTLLSLLGTVALKLFALTLFAAGTAAITVAIGIIYFVASYQEQRDADLKTQKFLDFATIKVKCAEEIIRRHNITLANAPRHLVDDTPSMEVQHRMPLTEFHYVNKNKLQKLKNALNPGMLVFAMLFGSFYLGATTLATAFGASAAVIAMSGGIALGIAAGVALAIGAYCIYSQYQTSVNTEKREKFLRHTDNIFRHRRFECYELQKQVQKCEQNLLAPARSNSAPENLHTKAYVSDTHLSSDQNHLFMRRRTALRINRPIKNNLVNDNIATPQPHQ